jgi:siroheme synthase (precorrin-2 oxidase/ferrochelatase)
VIRRPPFLVAISSSGEAPALARLLREMFDAFLPSESWVLYAQELRAKWKAERVPFGDRFADLVRAFKERSGASPSISEPAPAPSLVARRGDSQ